MDYYYDDLDYEDLQSDYDNEYLDGSGSLTLAKSESLEKIVDFCILPSLIQVSSYICIIMGWSLMYRIACLMVYRLRQKKEWLQHLLSTVFGLACICCAIGWKALIVLFLSIVAYILMLIVEYHRIRNIGLIIAVCTISSHFLYEAFWQVPETWQMLRGTQMVVTMKVISLAFDLESVGNKNQPAPIPSMLTYLGYMFCPPTSVLGPWIPFSVYLRSLTPSAKVKRKWILWCISNLLAAMLFVSLSNCISLLFFISEQSLKWLITVRDAFSIRCSHYFICFLTQASLAAGNISFRSDEIPNKLFGHMITKPWLIEFPRSLSSAIRNWNIPMHKWLKTYVFQATFKRTQMYLGAILVTYLVSSLLHGMHFRIYLVLISLAIFAYVENLARSKIAEIFNACITANGCKKPCQFKYCRSHSITMSASLIVISVNLFFGLLAAFHLAYLGVMLSTSGNEHEDLAITSGIKRWHDLGYLSHIVTLCVYLFYRII